MYYYNKKKITMSFVYMKILESRPHRYDIGMGLSTIGGLTKTKKYIATQINLEEKVLDLGCGTGTLAELCVQQGANVVGIDANEGMLNIAKINSPETIIVHSNLANVDNHFTPESFDVIVSTLVFSELSDAERTHIFKQMKVLLKKNGRIYIADEVVPDNSLLRIVRSTIRFPLLFMTWVLTQNTTTAIKNFEQEFTSANFIVTHKKTFMFGMLTLYSAKNV